MNQANTKLLQTMSSRERPQRANALYAIGVFGWRSWRKTVGKLHYLAIDSVIFPAVFLLIFTYLFGGAISGSTGNYLQFLLPGMMVYTVTTMTVYIGIGIKTDIERGVFNRFRTLPFWQPAAIIGTMMITLLQFAAALVTTFGIGMLLGFRPDAGIAGALLAFLLVMFYAFCLSWIFACLGIVVKKTETLSTMSYLVLYPLMFTSNVFADTSTMPAWLGRIVDFNPVSLASAAARGLVHGTAETSTMLTTFGGLGMILIIFMPLTFWFYRRKTNE
ncbi:transport permease protein [Paenibacillus montaniterrae]|uniref:Transport permease protein n=1 Tax=Paenibacillus montaniterrae TaxID=429341 RepID=A0A919YPN3_9BACL|nr:ABC transporter permease [Paenibacillus montaniterrae]GIP17370.1 transport permease protein [Paenibacillus montaniterrae]